MANVTLTRRHFIHQAKFQDEEAEIFAVKTKAGLTVNQEGEWGGGGRERERVITFATC